MLKRILNWLALHLLPPIGTGAIRLLRLTMKIEVKDGERVDALYRQGTHIILTFWHAHQLMIPVGYRGAAASVLISQHRDGELIARIISRFGHRAVRGSSTRGGALALRELIRIGRSGADLAVTPDGPKGPRQVVKLGVVQLAKATGLPIVPLSFGCSKKKSSRAGIASWSHTHFHGGFSCGGSRCGYRPMPMGLTWKPSALNSKSC